MKFDWKDPEVMVSHWMLQDIDVATAISKTPEWKNDQTTVAKVTVNGVELPFESLEKYLLVIYNGLEARAKEQYADLDAEVQRRLEKRMQDEAAPILSKMRELQDVLESAGDLIKPYWEA